MRRTTIELDQDLLERAQRALGSRTIRETVEEALRRAAEASESEDAERSARQNAFLLRLAQHVDVEVLSSGQMWR